MVRVLMSKRSHAQFAAGLAALPVPVETILMDDAGALGEGDRRVEPAAARPDVVWLTLEAVMANQFNALLALIPQCGTVKFVQTTSSGLDAPGYIQVAVVRFVQVLDALRILRVITHFLMQQG